MQKKIINPRNLFFLATSGIMFMLGGGVAHYFGAEYPTFLFWLGLGWQLSVHIAGFFLLQNFTQLSDEINHYEIYVRSSRLKISILFLSILFLSFTGIFWYFLYQYHKVTIYLAALIVITLIGLVVYAVPPINISKKGFQEIGLAIFQGCLAPGLGFFILTNKFHRLLLLIVFPLTLLSLAYYISTNFSSYATDLKRGKLSFVLVSSWRQAAPIHHLLITTCYSLFILGFGLGLPFSIFWVILLTLPLAGLQIFWLNRIIKGGNPFWIFFNVLTASVYGISAYLLAYNLWIN
jgi:hypothetical protein